MSVREQARKAAVAILDETYPTWVKRHDVPASTFDRVTIDFEKQTQDLANAASDVWEPLLRELLDRLDEFQDGHPCCDADHDGLITRVREVLG